MTLAKRMWRGLRRRLTPPRRHPVAGVLARTYLRGHGLEIGALHNPLPVPPEAHVTYVDRLPVDALRQQYPDLRDKPLVAVDLVDDGERLPRVADDSQDFVIANHFLEHCEDPLGTLGHLFRVLRPGGILYMALPDKRYTFDAPRPLTDLAHLRADHAHGPAGSRRAHYEEYVRLVHGVTDPEELQRHTDDLMARGYSIHFHVWTQKEMLELLLALREAIGFDFEATCKREHEMIFVLRKHQVPDA